MQQRPEYSSTVKQEFWNLGFFISCWTSGEYGKEGKGQFKSWEGCRLLIFI